MTPLYANHKLASDCITVLSMQIIGFATFKFQTENTHHQNVDVVFDDSLIGKSLTFFGDFSASRLNFFVLVLILEF